MTLGMFAIVMLTLVYMSVMSLMFGSQTDKLAADLAAASTSSPPRTPATRSPPAELARPCPASTRSHR